MLLARMLNVRNSNRIRLITTSCLICFGEFVEGESVVEVSACSYAFHAECIQRDKLANIGIVHFCWKKCRSAQPEHANVELVPPPPLPKLPQRAFHAGTGFITTDCTIYLGEFVEVESVTEVPTCSHAFHAECIQTWLAYSNHAIPCLIYRVG
ncbi:hypothetical protein SO802_029143 [Lithocarpus litseifolius]|uniref:RING-type domain-containing protein n=1 Tax=Lithocarpus litseifolius TaxID=425828 RepID=A0AAW2BVH4_9ROSI